MHRAESLLCGVNSIECLLEVFVSSSNVFYFFGKGKGKEMDLLWRTAAVCLCGGLCVYIECVYVVGAVVHEHLCGRC